jgi:hypothetical protein
MIAGLPLWVQWAVVIGLAVWTVFIAWPYLRWTKRRIEATANAMESIQKFVENEAVPLVRDARAMVSGAQTVVDDLKSQNPKRILEFIDKLEKDGTIHKLAASIEQVVAKFKADGFGDGLGKTREEILRDAKNLK